MAAIDLQGVVQLLADKRPVFDRERDFQFAFSQALVEFDLWLEVRLEVPRRLDDGRREVTDILVKGPTGTCAIGLKYPTLYWLEETNGELFQLANHSANDLGRMHFVTDVTRLERLALSQGTPGWALFPTNDPRYWESSGGRVTNDAQFRIYQGRELSGTLRRGNGHESCTTLLRGSYRVT